MTEDPSELPSEDLHIRSDGTVHGSFVRVEGGPIVEATVVEWRIDIYDGLARAVVHVPWVSADVTASYVDSITRELVMELVSSVMRLERDGSPLKEQASDILRRLGVVGESKGFS